MALNLVLVPQRQSSKGMALAWGEMEGVQAYEVFVAHKRLSPDELEAAKSQGGTDECLFATVGPEVKSVVDDLSPAGEPRFYAVAMLFRDGTVKPARFRTIPDGAPAGSLALSTARSGARSDPPAPRPRSTAEALTEPPGPAEVFGRGQPFIRVAPGAEPPRATPPPARAAPPEPPPPPAVEAPAAPSSIPLAEDLELRMIGANQTWDGLRIFWERDARAAAYEVIASDHQVFGDELKDALAGQADFTTAVAVPPSVTAVIDNVTPRDARGWYAVLVRSRDGKRAAHPFQVGDAATTGKPVAPFLNPNRTSEVRAEAEGMIEEAREQWRRWKSEQDGGARAEAKRLVHDALLVFPGLASARALAAGMG
jgi:hypothetical protein